MRLSGLAAGVIGDHFGFNRLSLRRRRRDPGPGAEIGEIGDTLQSNLDKVMQHGKRADAIVKNMLLHSRQGSGEHRPVDINALVEESLNLAYHGARAEKQSFNIKLERSFELHRRRDRSFPARDCAGTAQPDLQRLLRGNEAQSGRQMEATTSLR